MHYFYVESNIPDIGQDLLDHTIEWAFPDQVHTPSVEDLRLYIYQRGCTYSNCNSPFCYLKISYAHLLYGIICIEISQHHWNQQIFDTKKLATLHVGFNPLLTTIKS